MHRSISGSSTESRRARKVGTFAATALALASISAVQAANLLQNPTFEAPPGAASVDSTVAGWTLLLGAQRCTFANNTAGGTHSIWLKTFQPAGGGVQQSVGITAGANYTFSGFNRFEASYPSTESVIFRQVEWLDGGGGVLSFNRFDTLPTDIGTVDKPVNTWLSFSSNVVAPANAVTARLTYGWDGGGTVVGGQSAFVDDVVFDGPGTPPPPITSDWVPNASGDWNSSLNWANGIVPNAIGDTANFLGAFTAAHTVYSDTAVTVGTMKFDNANTYVIAGAGSLTVDVATGSGALNVVTGSHKINLPLRLNDNTTATVATGATLTIADPLTLANGAVLTKAGAGTLEIISTTTTIGGAATLATSAGNTNLRLDTGSAVTLASSGGTTTAFASQRVAGVNITGGSLKLDSSGATKVLKTNALTVGAGQLDVGDNGAIVVGGNVETIRTSIISGRAGGAWNGNGINTSAGTSGRGVGYANASDLGSPASFLGEGFAGAAVLLRYTFNGDTNLDGTVNFGDLLKLAQNYGVTGTARWVHGDSNYDATVNFGDLLSLAQNYGGTLPAQAPQASADFASDYALALSLVPEPTSLAALALGATALGRRRRA